MSTGSEQRGWAVVTGASSGMGRAFARELSRRGYRVLAIARRQDRLEALARETGKQQGGVESLIADLKTAEGLDRTVRRLAELGRVDLLVNNAGIATGGDFMAAPIDEELGAIRLNVEAVVTLAHAVMPGMVRSRNGAVINVASVVAFQPFPHFAVYAATKAFVLSFTEALAEELKGTKVRVLALCPGAARTEIEVFAHNQGLLGRLPKLDAEQIVVAALRALDVGRVVEVVGWINKMLVFQNRLLPRWMVRWFMGVVTKPPLVRMTSDGRGLKEDS